MAISNAIQFLLLFLFFPTMGSAQALPPDYIPEHILLQTDRQLYISGETIWFKVFTFAIGEGRLSDFSKIAYLEIISERGIAISRVKVDLVQGQGTGTIELPKAMSSGNYSLRAYTQAMRNGDKAAFGKTSLIILHPEQAIARAADDHPEAYQQFEPVSSLMSVAPEKYLSVSVQPSQSSFSQRSMATLEITTTDASGKAVPAQVSLSVALQSPAEEAGLFQKGGTPPAVLSAAIPSGIAFPAETYGIRIAGMVINENSGMGETAAEVYLAFPGKTALLYAAITDEAGHFSLLLPKLYGLRQMVIQVRPKTEAPVRIELIDEFHEIQPTTSEPFILPPRWIPAANTALVNAQVNQAYQAFELPPVYTAENKFEEVAFFGRPDVQYLLDDYTRFPLPEFFFEIVLEVMVRGKFGSEYLAVFFEQQSPFPEAPPLLLVDGVPVFDQSVFLKINNKLIASTEIVTSPYWLNPFYFNGIIQLSSFEHDARCFELPETALQRAYLTLLPHREFQLPDYAANPDSRLPDFRNTLYWDTTIQTDAYGKATVSFYTSDTMGDFEIRVEAVSDTGLAGSASGVMRVVKEVK